MVIFRNEGSRLYQGYRLLPWTSGLTLMHWSTTGDRACRVHTSHYPLGPNSGHTAKRSILKTELSAEGDDGLLFLLDKGHWAPCQCTSGHDSNVSEENGYILITFTSTLNQSVRLKQWNYQCLIILSHPASQTRLSYCVPAPRNSALHKQINQRRICYI